MISVSGKDWEEIKTNKRNLEKIKIENNFSEIVSKIVIDRNFDEFEIYSITNNIEINNPFINNNDFENSFITLDNYIKNNGKILIIGDYDVDGSVATSLIIKLLKLLRYPYKFYIPDRSRDGYGASLSLIKKLCKNDPDLVIMVDCGSNSNATVDYLNQKNIKSIIIDHHEIYRPYPKTKNLINPKKECSYNKLDYLCSSALTYFFIDYFLKKKKLQFKFSENLIYVLLATVTDVMPLRKLNRIIAQNVIRNFDINKNEIFRNIFKIKNKRNHLSISDLGFLIGPILNSSGRIGDSKKTVELLISQDSFTQKKILKELVDLNEKRKVYEEAIIKEINLSKIANENKNLIILKIQNINEGLIGIVAAKIKDYFNKPTIIFTNSGILLKGSARSTEEFNIGKLIKIALDKKLINSGGGHNLAAGITLESSKFDEFKKFIFENYSKNIHIKSKKYISKLNLTSINKNFFNDIKKLEPFGSYNQKPYFFIENLKIIKTTLIKKKYLNCTLKSSSGKTIRAMSFNLLESKISEILMNYKNNINVIIQINNNLGVNNNSLQLSIIDIII